jgi:hypothetical protein
VGVGTRSAELAAGQSESLANKVEMDNYFEDVFAEIGTPCLRREACIEVAHWQLDGERKDFVMVASIREWYMLRFDTRFEADQMIVDIAEESFVLFDFDIAAVLLAFGNVVPES